MQAEFKTDGTAIFWQTETLIRDVRNLLRPDARFGWRADAADDLKPPVIEIDDDAVVMTAPESGSGQWVFPWDPTVTPVTVFPAAQGNGAMRLPLLVHAPDYGTRLVTGPENATAQLIGDRHKKANDLIIAVPTGDEPSQLIWTPCDLPAPEGVAPADWDRVRDGWMNGVQLTAAWGETNRPFSSPPGLMANNVISDPASCSLWFYADQAFWTPEPAPGISLMPPLRRTIEFWLDQRMQPSGELICYWDKTDFLDACAGPLIAAWDYVEITGDSEWFSTYIDKLEKVAEFLASRDINQDGLVEAVQPGTPGTLVDPKRSCAWWDALNCGHQDAYCNALIYRAWRCLADLENQLGQMTKAQRFTDLADRLHAAYRDTFLNPETGVLMWWKDREGGIHDFWSPTINGLAIEYGLVTPGEGRDILERLHAKMKEVGFDRFDLGLPPQLIPVPRGDNLLGQAWIEPQQEDGSDMFQHYMNGGITAGHTLHFLTAHYAIDWPDPADRILDAMLERQRTTGFHNGVTDSADQGLDWTDWNGNPCGYEGYLADSFRVFQAVFMKNKQSRARLLRPVMEETKDSREAESRASHVERHLRKN